MLPAMYWWETSCEEDVESCVDRGCNEDTATLRSCSERDTRVQRYVFFANNCAIARPMPRLPPVTRMCRGLAVMAGFS